MATTQQKTHGPKWLDRIAKNPLWALATVGLIFFGFEIFAYAVKQICLLMLVLLGTYSAFWFIFSSNAPTWFRTKKQK